MDFRKSILCIGQTKKKGGEKFMYPLHNIWNYDYIQQQAQQQYHRSQVYQVLDAAKKLQDFLDGVDRVDAAYHGALASECCAVLANYFNRHSAKQY